MTVWAVDIYLSHYQAASTIRRLDREYFRKNSLAGILHQFFSSLISKTKLPRQRPSRISKLYHDMKGLASTDFMQFLLSTARTLHWQQDGTYVKRIFEGFPIALYN